MPKSRTSGGELTLNGQARSDTHYRNEFPLSLPSNQPATNLWRRQKNSTLRIPPPSSTTKTRKPSSPSTRASGTLKLAEPCRRTKPASSCPSGLPSPLHAKGAERPLRNHRPHRRGRRRSFGNSPPDHIDLLARFPRMDGAIRKHPGSYVAFSALVSTKRLRVPCGSGGVLCSRSTSGHHSVLFVPAPRKRGLALQTNRSAPKSLFFFPRKLCFFNSICCLGVATEVSPHPPAGGRKTSLARGRQRLF